MVKMMTNNVLSDIDPRAVVGADVSMQFWVELGLGKIEKLGLGKREKLGLGV
jgi:hypothetical protein